jgi:hypothetical protein
MAAADSSTKIGFVPTPGGALYVMASLYVYALFPDLLCIC